jgi:hypothetical protein
MKKLILFLFLVILFSCKKEDPVYCWDCMRVTTAPNYYQSITVTVCGMTYDERTDFEKSNYQKTGDWTLSMNCKLKQ